MITAGGMESSLPSSTKGLDSSLRIKRYIGGARSEAISQRMSTLLAGGIS